MTRHLLCIALVAAGLAGCKSDADKAAEAEALQAIQTRATAAAKALCAGDIAGFASGFMTEEEGSKFADAVTEAFDEGYKEAHPILGRAAGAMSQAKKLAVIQGRVAKAGAQICTLEGVEIDSFAGQYAKVDLKVKFRTDSKALSTKWTNVPGSWLIQSAADVQKETAARVRAAASKS